VFLVIVKLKQNEEFFYCHSNVTCASEFLFQIEVLVIKHLALEMSLSVPLKLTLLALMLYNSQILILPC
jgi:hypothetical protein